MTDIVTRLMCMVDNYADAQEGFGKGELTLAQRDNARRIIEARLREALEKQRAVMRQALDALSQAAYMDSDMDAATKALEEVLK